MRLRVKKSTFLRTSTKPWRVLVLSPMGWTNITGAYFATQQEALDWIFGSDDWARPVVPKTYPTKSYPKLRTYEEWLEEQVYGK